MMKFTLILLIAILFTFAYGDDAACEAACDKACKDKYGAGVNGKCNPDAPSFCFKVTVIMVLDKYSVERKRLSRL